MNTRPEDVSLRDQDHYLILIVDDEPDARKMMRTVLDEVKQYEVLEAVDGVDALKKLGRRDVDMVITDVKMPRMDGIELLEKIRELRSNLPVIICTGFGGDIGPKTLALGADDCIYLPFRVNEFKFRIERTFRFYELLRARDYLEQKNKELWSRAIRDRLTGLYNRQRFEEFFGSEFERSKRYRSHLGCIIFDIDHFKKINDEYGHLVGDVVLREIGQLVNGTLRQVDFAARYGGEEFVVLLPETTREGIHLVGERLRQEVESHNFCEDYKPLEKPMKTVTVSLGAAYYPDERFTDAASFLQAADDMLYQAKRGGRNRMEVAWD